MFITRETDYAIRSMRYLAANHGNTVVVAEIAKSQGIPNAFAAKILQKLVRAELVQSIKGVKGGVRLARKPSQISLLDVIEAIRGPVALNICVVDKKSCDRSEYCSVHPIWMDINQELVKRLKKHKLSQLVRTPRK